MSRWIRPSPTLILSVFMLPLLREGESYTPTYHLFNEQTFQKMKSTAYLVNTRGERSIDENALARALKGSGSRARRWTSTRRSLLPADSPLRDP